MACCSACSKRDARRSPKRRDPTETHPPASGVRRRRAPDPVLERGSALVKSRRSQSPYWKEASVGPDLASRAIFFGYRMIEGERFAVFQAGDLLFAQFVRDGRDPRDRPLSRRYSRRPRRTRRSS